jgi:hypothetical protein
MCGVQCQLQKVWGVWPFKIHYKEDPCGTFFPPQLETSPMCLQMLSHPTPRYRARQTCTFIDLQCRSLQFLSKLLVYHCVSQE